MSVSRLAFLVMGVCAWITFAQHDAQAQPGSRSSGRLVTTDTGGARDPRGARDPGGHSDPKGVADPRGARDPRGVADPRGRRDPRGVADPRGRYDPRGPHVPPGRTRHHRNVIIVRPHGHWYGGYGHYHDDDDAYKWLAFTAITLKILDNINEEQQRAHEAAQVKATSAPVGEQIKWSEGNASGSVKAVREGTGSTGRYCREFQQTITVGGKTEEAYGTACQQPDGAWEIVSTDN